jgi:hypothetical protein
VVVDQNVLTASNIRTLSLGPRKFVSWGSLSDGTNYKYLKHINFGTVVLNQLRQLIRMY